HTATLYAPLSPDAYREFRDRLIREERERRRSGWTKSSKPTQRALDGGMKGFLATLPERLVQALALDTSDFHAAGWSDPPAMRRVLYCAPELTTAWRGKRRRSVPHERPDPEVARFVLAGRPRPRIEDTVRIAELMRLATLAQFGWVDVDGRRRPKAPSVISGRGDDGKPLRELNHAHAFWLPEDADGDGEIDHVVVYAAAAFNRECRQKLDHVTRLWIAKHMHDDDEGQVPDTGRQEWRLALEGFGSRDDFSDVSRLLGIGKVWRSVTPFLAAGHLKRGGYPAEIRRLLVKRGVVAEAAAARVEVRVLDGIEVRGRLRRSIHFHRFRSRGGEAQPDTTGVLLELTFAEPVKGPLALGYASHFGLGLFATVR
ncbi:MAG: type I-U CRISPR-associated protein Cas5/Cas6, partial [Rhodospirillaceae bacterium]|nr:type I-U CRISPR-associated protein Cas5/Cas6 [Rhodospirillaceae bacterium]